MLHKVLLCVLIIQRIYDCGASNKIEKIMQKLFHRNDLKCPEMCDDIKSISSYSYRLQCCVCKSSSTIEDNLGSLGIKYLSNQPGTELIFENDTHSYKYYELIYRNGNLTELPLNICEFESTLFKIDLTNNMIHNITGISCLQKLDTLLLKGNRVCYIRNQEILSLKFLRKLDLSFNKISQIVSGFAINVKGSLFNFDVSHNSIQSLDITNGLMSKQKCFCVLDYRHNRIKTIVNTNNWIFLGNIKSLGYGGMINLSNNSMEEIFDSQKIKYLGFKLIFTLRAIIHYGMDLRDNPWNCDCKLYPLAHSGKYVVNKLSRDYFHVKCNSPIDLRNTDIIELIKQNELQKLTCDLSVVDRCPPKCNCFYQPGIRNRTVIDCSSARYRNFPLVLPNYMELEVDFSRNHFIAFPDLTGSISYMRHITILNMTKNKIQYILSRDFDPLINAKIDLRDNQIIKIPRSFQVLDPCKIYLHTTKVCKCNDKWLKEWLLRVDGKCAKHVEVLCSTIDGVKPIQTLTESQLGCIIPNYKLPFISKCVIIAFISLVTMATVSFTFRYEIFLVARGAMKSMKSRKVIKTYLYDAYIACNEEDESIREWVMSVLLPYLSKSNLKVFWPCLHSMIGTPRGEEIINVMSKCRTFVILLSADYDGLINWHEFEWKHAWHNWALDIDREFVIVNYDMITARGVSSKYIGAFLRLGMFIDFSNRKKCIENEIKNSITRGTAACSSSDDYNSFEGNEGREIDEMSPLVTTNMIFPTYGKENISVLAKKRSYWKIKC